MAIYARENGEGMMFPAEETDTESDSDKPGDDRPKGPTLKVIK